MNEQFFLYFIAICLGGMLLISFGLIFVIGSFKKSSEIRWNSLRDVLFYCEKTSASVRENERRLVNLKEQLEKETDLLKVYLINLQVTLEQQRNSQQSQQTQPRIRQEFHEPVRRRRGRRALIEQKTPASEDRGT